MGTGAGDRANVEARRLLAPPPGQQDFFGEWAGLEQHCRTVSTFYVRTCTMQPHRIIGHSGSTRIPTRSVDMHVAQWPRLGRKIAWNLYAYRNLLKTY
ncbi:hypothetical protein BCEP27_30137 [Burkholderia cepacia]